MTDIKEAQAALVLARKEYWRADHALLRWEALAEKALTDDARAEILGRVTEAYILATNRLADLRQAELDLRLAEAKAFLENRND